MTVDKQAWTSLFQDVFVGAMSAGDEAALAMAADVVGKSTGHLVALLLSDFPGVVDALEQSQKGSALLSEAIATLRTEAKEKRDALEARLRLATTSFEMRSVDVLSYSANESAVRSVRYADIAILQRPTPGLESAIRRDIVQDVICKSGKPVLLVPPGWRRGLALRSLVVAWDGSRAAARALSDCAALLRSADRMTVLVVSGNEAGETRGQDICVHLARHQLKVELKVVAATRGELGAIILRAAGECDADLLVMGGFGHSRAREWALGGVTRHILGNAEIPVVVSH